MPVYFISGSCDWICSIDSIKEYANAISAPEVKMITIEGCDIMFNILSQNYFQTN